MKKKKFSAGTYATLLAGTEVIICNPEWDGDKLETQFYLKIKVTKNACIELLNAVEAYAVRAVVVK